MFGGLRRTGRRLSSRERASDCSPPVPAFGPYVTDCLSGRPLALAQAVLTPYGWMDREEAQGEFPLHDMGPGRRP